MNSANPHQKQVRRLLVRVFGGLLSLGLAVLLLKQVDLADFQQRMAQVNPLWLLTALAIYLLMNIFRALRYRALLGQDDLPLQKLVAITLYHNLWVRLLPFKIGELSYILLMRRHFGHSVAQGVSSLTVARLLELLMVMLGGAFGLLLATTHFSGQTVLGVALLLVALGYLAALYFSGILLRFVLPMLRWLERSLPRFGTLILKQTTNLSVELDRLRRGGAFERALGASVVTYGASVAFNLVLLAALGIPVTAALILAASIVILLEALPLTTISGLGIIEGGWTFGLVLFADLTTGQAASIGFFLHGCQIFAAALFGFASYGLLQVMTLKSIPAE